MNEIVWLSHGGKGSGWFRSNGHVPGSQGGKIHQFFSKRVGRKRMNDYINSPEFVRGDYSGYVGKNVTTLMKTKSRMMDNYSGPNWTYGRRDQEVTFKKPKPRLTAGSSEVNKTAAEQKSSNKKKYDSPELNKTTPKQKTSNKKKYNSPSFAKSMDQKAATEALKADTEYRKALAENQRIRNPKLSPDNLTTAATKFNDASKYMDSVSKGVSSAWNDLHNAKYRNKDRSKKVKDLSNAELQNAITRIKLEQEYNLITMPQKKSGYDKTMAALSVIGTAATVTATGLSIAAGVKALKRQ